MLFGKISVFQILSDHQVTKTPWYWFYRFEGQVFFNTDFLLYWDGRFMVWLMFTSKLTTTNRGLWVNQILT
ncbi:hypothetical protein V6Z11_A05G321200 [Gossypium hirsutum]